MAGLNDVTAFLPSVIRLGRGLWCRVSRKDRKLIRQPLELYSFEACPYCRKVREVLSELDLDYVEHTAAEGSPSRKELKERGGKEQVPFLIDPNTQTKLYESDAIIAYLNREYGNGRTAGWPIPLPSVLDNAISGAASLPRFNSGRSYRGRPHKGLKRLELFNMEGSPYCRKVREALCELNLEYLVRNVPKGSPQRAELEKRGGKVQVPYLIDPNTDTEMYESDDIVAYLWRTYGPKSRQ